MRSDTTPAGARDLAKIWEATRERIDLLLRDRPETVVDGAVTTVPGTTVRDVLAHLIDTASTATNDPRRLTDVALALPEAVPARSAVTLTGLLAEWDKATTLVRRQLESNVELASATITAAVMCEHDLRTALDVPGARDDIAIKVALDELSGRLSDRIERAQLPPLRVTVEQWGTIVGAGRARSCVVADRFEFVRAMSGRRSAAEIRRWNWGVAPETYLPVIAEVALVADEVHERDPRIPEHMRDREFVL
jgi:hypothetical protein